MAFFLAFRSAIRHSTGMSQVDRIKESIAYLKAWLTILVVTHISLVAWLAANYRTAEFLLVVLDLLAIIGLSGTIAGIHRACRRVPWALALPGMDLL